MAHLSDFSDFETYQTMDGIENDVFIRQPLSDVKLERPAKPEVSANDRLEAKYGTDKIPTDVRAELWPHVETLIAESKLTMHPLAHLAALYNERGGETEEPKTEEPKKSWFSSFF